MGSVVLAHDMVGWGESNQLPHRSSANVLGLQLWNSIRAVDLLASLAEVDSQRIGVAGFSGGATQSFLLAAAEERVAASVCVAQVSAHFFGGCRCERGISIQGDSIPETSNAEVAAVAAPRPQLLISTGWDWSRNTPTIEYPFIRRAYEFEGVPERLESLHLADEGHDFAYTKRVGVYRFLAKHLALDLEALHNKEGEIDESEAVLCDRQSLSVFDKSFPRRARALNGPKEVAVAFARLPRSS
jgi:dienelactone hydrolase